MKLFFTDEELDEQDAKIRSKLPDSTNNWINDLYDEDWFYDKVAKQFDMDTFHNPPFDQPYCQRISQMALSRIANAVTDFYQHGQPHKELFSSYEDMFGKGLELFFDALAYHFKAYPNEPEYEVAKAILGGQLMQRDGNTITIAGLSKFTIQKRQERYQVVLQNPSPFTYNKAMSQGLEKIILAFHYAKSIKINVNVAGYYLADILTPLVELLSTLKKTGAFDIPAQLRTFPFKNNVSRFITDERSYYYNV